MHRIVVRLRLALFSYLLPMYCGVIAPVFVYAQVGAALPPPRTYFTDAQGRRMGVQERWGVDAGGERHGTYMKFNENGLVVASSTYVHGTQTGPGVYYADVDEATTYLVHKRPNTRFTGTYKNGVPVGVWSAYEDVSKEHYLNHLYDANGKLIRRTFLKKEQPVRIEDYDREGNLVQTTFLENGKVRVVNAKQAEAEVTQARAEAQARQREESTKQDLLEEAKRSESALLANLTRVGFAPDSYVLTSGGVGILKELAAYANARAKAQSPIPVIYVATYAKKGSTDAAGQKMMYVLTRNRAYCIKSQLLNLLDNKNTAIVTYACGATLEKNSAEPLVVLDVRQDLPAARQTAEALSQQFALPPSTSVIANEELKANLLKTIRLYWDDRRLQAEMADYSARPDRSRPDYLRKIPSEFWLSDMTEGVPAGYAQAEGTEQFKQQVAAVFEEMHKKYGPANATTEPSVLFTADLEKRMKARGAW